MTNNSTVQEQINADGEAALAGGEFTDGLKIDVDKDVIVHTMPKHFLKTTPTAKEGKRFGILILIIGGIFLIASLIFLYYYLVADRAEKPGIVNEPVPPAAGEENLAGQTAAVEDDQAGSEETAVDTGGEEPASADIIAAATTTEEAVIATTTEESASTTKIIQIPAASSTEQYKLAADRDGDGLADLEEILFDCNINSKDSDGDGYEDLAEILNLYNPAGGGSLMVNPNIEKYINSSYNYYLYYPYVWEIDDSKEDSVFLKQENNQFVQIIIQLNPEKVLLEDWYFDQTGLTELNLEQKMYKKGWHAIKSKDGFTVYLTKPGSDKIFVITYNIGTSEMVSYKSIFEMIIKSFEAS
ncbi:MAG: hypothetical protein U9R06_01130 [Patescibacteria group bacterium]|nr:hypothetical protein [Patescibacteria group bacterium]